jgi:hypothetical protein
MTAEAILAVASAPRQHRTDVAVETRSYVSCLRWGPIPRGIPQLDAKEVVRMRSWEYLVVNAIIEHLGNLDVWRPQYVNGVKQPNSSSPVYQQMNEWGDQGWELVGILPTDNRHLRLIFKRRKTLSRDTPVRMPAAPPVPVGRVGPGSIQSGQRLPENRSEAAPRTDEAVDLAR